MNVEIERWDVWQHSLYYSVVVVSAHSMWIRALVKSPYPGMTQGLMTAMAFEEDEP